jgi:hypothetical protein
VPARRGGTSPSAQGTSISVQPLEFLAHAHARHVTLVPDGSEAGCGIRGVAGAIANTAWSRIVHLPPTEGSLIGSTAHVWGGCGRPFPGLAVEPMLHAMLWLGFAFLVAGAVLVASDELAAWRDRRRGRSWERRSGVSPP